MMKRFAIIGILLLTAVLIMQACVEQTPTPDDTYDFQTPAYFPKIVSPTNNPLTKSGVSLGRMLFYDPILSQDSTISCSSCHNIANAFAEDKKYSVGVGGATGDVNAMAIINLAWQQKFFWNGRATSLEEQALGPINNPLEMHETSENVAAKLSQSKRYAPLFKQAFGSATVTPEMIGKAISQFERIIVSNQSTYDKFYEIQEQAFTAEEYAGFRIFFTERGQCFHCHGANGTLLAHNLDTIFRNNGLLTDQEMIGKGLSFVTKKATDDGKFKVPTLRNIELTGPYMHDGRFATLAELMDFYSSGIKQNANLDINFTKSPERLEQYGGLGLTSTEKQQVIAFLKTLTDTAFTHNPAYQNPFNK